MIFFGGSRYSKAKEIHDAGLASNSAETCRRGAEEIQQLIDEEWADGTSEFSIIPFRALRNELNDRAEELDRESAWRKRMAAMEAEAEEEARRRAARKRETSYYYDPFDWSPLEERQRNRCAEPLDSDYPKYDNAGRPTYINEDGDVWGWEN